MSKFELTALYTANLSINNAYSLFKTSIEIAIPFQSYLGPIENAALNNLIADNEKFGKQINKNQKSKFSDELKVLNKDRVSFWNEICRIDKSYLKSADEAKKRAAQTISLFITPYSDAAKLPLNSKSGVFSEIVLKYRSSPELVEAAGVMGIDSSFNALDAKNTGYDTVYKQRNDEYAKAEASGTTLRPHAVVSYTTFCTAIVQAANLTPNDQIITLFNNLNELRKKYHALGGNGKDVPPVDGGAK